MDNAALSGVWWLQPGYLALILNLMALVYGGGVIHSKVTAAVSATTAKIVDLANTIHQLQTELKHLQANIRDDLRSYARVDTVQDLAGRITYLERRELEKVKPQGDPS